MNIKTVYNDFCGRSIKVFVFDFAFRAAVNGVRKVRTEFGNIEIVRTGADLLDRKSTRLNSSHSGQSRMPSSA